MKRITLFFILFCSIVKGFAIENEKTVKSKIDNVTVFLQGAQVYRSTNISYSAGTSKIILENLEEGIMLNSIQAGGTGSFIILDVQGRTQYPEPGEIKKADPRHVRKINILEDSISEVNFTLEDIRNRREVLNTEKQFILVNRLLRGETRKDSVAIVKDAMEYLRARLNNINSELLKLKKEESKITEQLQGMNERLTELINFGNNNNASQRLDPKANHQVVVTIAAEAVGSGVVHVNYLLNNAGWSPSYDLRAKNLGAPMQLTYKANVYQNTGIDWNEVKLKLSTGNPNQSNVKPALATWYLDYYSYRKKAKVRSAYRYNLQDTDAPAAAPSYESSKAATLTLEDKEVLSSADFTSEVVNFTNLEFDIKIPYTIPSDGAAHLVAVKNQDVPATFIHYAVPKLDKDAFLIARITNWEDLNLIPATANIFFEGTYVGQTYIDPGTDEDTLDVTLGRDRSVVVTRTKLKDKTKSAVLSDNCVKSVSYEISMRNARTSNTLLIIEDQVPVSRNNEISVDVDEVSGGERNKDTGIVTWKIDLKPKDSKKIRLAYTVKSPKDKPVANL